MNESTPTLIKAPFLDSRRIEKTTKILRRYNRSMDSDLNPKP
jgi:hypothetical protein